MASKRKWSRRVTETSNALTLEPDVFKKRPKEIAASLRRSAERSKRRRSSPYQSAMSMLTFYANRAGTSLSPTARKRIEAAKRELRKLYDKPRK